MGFIEVVDKVKKRHLINIRYIEEVIESDRDGCYIYLGHNSPNATEQDYYLVDEPYETIKRLIEVKEGTE
jgi:hypothetical protein